MSISGYPCRAWVKPKHQNRDDQFGESAENYCRDASGEGAIWCYLQDPVKRWEICARKSKECIFLAVSSLIRINYFLSF